MAGMPPGLAAYMAKKSGGSGKVAKKKAPGNLQAAAKTAIAGPAKSDNLPPWLQPK